MTDPLLLCADAGSPRLVVAVARGATIVSEVSGPSMVAHGAVILSLIDDALARAPVTKGQLDALVVALGPGSFTGLRTALSTFKGLALGLGKPLAGVSTMQALARSVATAAGMRVAVCMDARKGQVYGAVFELGVSPSTDTAPVEPCVASPEDWLARTAASGAQRWAGDGPIRFPEVFSAIASDHVWKDAVPSMAALSACALHRLPSGDALATLEPLYVRRSYTELSLGLKPKGG